MSVIASVLAWLVCVCYGRRVRESFSPIANSARPHVGRHNSAPRSTDAASSERSATWSWSTRWAEQPFNLDNHMRMVEDATRTAGFRLAIERRLRDHKGEWTVLDIGTGPFCLLAMFAAQAGAQKCYAVEGNAESAAHACEFVAAAEASGNLKPGTIEVIEGLSTEITLPEKVDLLVTEIVGSIASEEGMYTTVADAKLRHLKAPEDPKSFIPVRCQTIAAPVSFALHHRAELYRWDKVVGPLRLNCHDPWLVPLATPQLLEDFHACSCEKEGELAPGAHVISAPPLTFTLSGDLIESNTRSLTAEFLEEFTLEEEAKEAAEARVDGGAGAKDEQAESAATSAAEVYTERAVDAAAQVARTLSGLACWPRLVLDEGSVQHTSGSFNDEDDNEREELEQPILVEARGFDGSPRLSSWQTMLLLSGAKPTSIEAGDVFTVASDIKIGRQLDTPPNYTISFAIESHRNLFD